MPTIIKKPAVVEAAGNKPKVIEEFVGRVNSQTDSVSIARMRSPGGWTEPGQTPEFDEFTVVLKGALTGAVERRNVQRLGWGSRDCAPRRVGTIQHSRCRRCGVHCRLFAGILTSDGQPRWWN